MSEMTSHRSPSDTAAEGDILGTDGAGPHRSRGGAFGGCRISPARRVVILTCGAFLVYGGWAAAANLAYATSAAIRAGIGQGLSSALSTMFISTAIELCWARWKSSHVGMLLSWLVPSTITMMLHGLVQWLIGTPNVLLTISFPAVMGYVFALVYVFSLRLARTPRPQGNLDTPAPG